MMSSVNAEPAFAPEHVPIRRQVKISAAATVSVSRTLVVPTQPFHVNRGLIRSNAADYWRGPMMLEPPQRCKLRVQCMRDVTSGFHLWVS
jgi:hypothetical protein